MKIGQVSERIRIGFFKEKKKKKQAAGVNDNWLVINGPIMLSGLAMSTEQCLQSHTVN